MDRYEALRDLPFPVVIEALGYPRDLDSTRRSELYSSERAGTSTNTTGCFRIQRPSLKLLWERSNHAPCLQPLHSV